MKDMKNTKGIILYREILILSLHALHVLHGSEIETIPLPLAGGFIGVGFDT
jgi:hypothetical protein